MTKPLYREIDHGFEKTASTTTKLSDNVAGWPQELMAALFKQHDWLGKMSVNMQVEQQDTESGYMYGFFMVTNLPPARPTARGATKKMAPQAPAGPTLRVPILINDSRVSPFDVFINAKGTFLPLTEKAASVEIFNASPYSAAKAPRATAGDMLVSGIPGRMGGQTKTASVICQDKLAALEARVQDDEWLRNCSNITESLARFRPQSGITKTASVEGYSADAAVLARTSGGYSFHTATRNGFEIETREFTKGEAFSIFPSDLIKEAMLTGTAVLPNPDNVGLRTNIQIEDEQFDLVKEAGIYMSMHEDGTATRTAVLPNLRDIYSNPYAGNMVINTRGAAYQADAAGTKVQDLDFSKLGSLEFGTGDGLILSGSDVYGPITIKHKVAMLGEEYYMFEDEDGNSGKLIQSDVVCPHRIADNDADVLIPKLARFLPVNYSQESRIKSDVQLITKEAGLNNMLDAITLRKTGGDYTFITGEGASSGGLDKVASLLLLDLLGATGTQAKDYVAIADTDVDASFIPTGSVDSEVVKEASDDLVDETVALLRSVDLVKVASLLTQPESIDNMLGLNFVTPENIQRYVDALPAFEETMSKMAELLVAVRMGVTDIPESAVVSGLTGMSRVVGGLKKLAMRVHSYSRATENGS